MATPKNRNYLSTIAYKLIFNRMPNVNFYCQSVTTPDLRLGTAEMGTIGNILKVPGDELRYGELLVKFLVDEDMLSYIEVYQWIRYLSGIEPGEFCGSDYLEKYGENYYSDAVLISLNSNFNENVIFVFRDIYPTFLSGIIYDSSFTDEAYASAEVNFRVNQIDILNKNKTPAWLKAN